MTDARDRGWGSGWPNCQTAQWRWYTAAGHRWLFHEKIGALACAFIEEFHRRVERVDPAQSWSAVCRAIKGTQIPSNHSWALAFDVNSAKHPWHARGTFTAAQVREIEAILAEPRFRNWRWGGHWNAGYLDEMHFEFVGTPDEADLIAATIEREDDMPLTDADIEKIRTMVRAELKTADETHKTRLQRLAQWVAGKENASYSRQSLDVERVPNSATSTTTAAGELKGTVTVTLSPQQ